MLGGYQVVAGLSAIYGCGVLGCCVIVVVGKGEIFGGCEDEATALGLAYANRVLVLTTPHLFIYIII